MTAKRKSKGVELKPYLLAITIPLALFSIYIGYRVYSTDKILIPVSVFAIFAGLFYEYIRISDSRSTFLGIALFAYIFSFFIFLPFKHETNYFLNNHIEMWPYLFCFFFIVFAIAFAGNKIVQKLAEGITLMQSLAIIYWIFDVSLVANSFIILLKLLGLSFAVFSIYFALNTSKISRTNRLYLSVWSSLIMLVFSIDNIYQLYQYPPIERINNLANTVFIVAQFFLLGVSSIYIVQNYFMLVEFLPGKHKFFNEEYFKDLKKLKKQHVDRYSTSLITKFHSVICILITGTIYGLNYHFQFLPRNFVIWAVFVLFPLALSAFDNSISETLQTNDATNSYRQKGGR